MKRLEVEQITDAISGPTAITMLLDAFVLARNGTTVECGVGQITDASAFLVLMRVGKGPLVAMPVLQARGIASFCLGVEAPLLAPTLADLARHLIELADLADAMALRRLH